MGNFCDKNTESHPIDNIGAKSSLQIRKSLQNPPLPTLQSQQSGQKKEKIESKMEPTIQVTVSPSEDSLQLGSKLESTECDKTNKLKSKGISRSSSLSSLGSNGTSRKNLTISDFIIDRMLGKGGFGQVFLVTKKETQRKYAMKAVKKVDMVKLQLIESIILEKAVLLKSTHPFITSLKYCIQTEKKVYLIMEYIQGGEVYTLLKHVGSFSENVAKFIIAEIILGIQYLHETLKIIYRDLKPENILLTKSGHIKISDFGLSKEFHHKDDKTFTFAGTPEYLAPEIVQNKGHDKNVDLWGIGIFLFELVAGYTPFNDKKRNLEKIQKQIIINKPVYPSNFSHNLKDLISKLLVAEPSQRIGADSFSDLKAHAFFSDLDWDQFLRLEIDSPIKKYTEQDKPLKIERQRDILETPMSLTLKMPQIKGLTYNIEETVRNEKDIDPSENQFEIVKENFDEESPRKMKKN